MEHFLERLTSKVSSAMNQADETALQSEHYKEIVKEITVIALLTHDMTVFIYLIK